MQKSVKIDISGPITFAIIIDTILKVDTLRIIGYPSMNNLIFMKLSNYFPVNQLRKCMIIILFVGSRRHKHYNCVYWEMNKK